LFVGITRKEMINNFFQNIKINFFKKHALSEYYTIFMSNSLNLFKAFLKFVEVRYIKAFLNFVSKKK